MTRLRFKSTPVRAQTSFFDPDVLLAQRPLNAESFYVRFRTICDEVLPDALFADLYTGIGRPPISPSLLMRVHLLMGHARCGDEMAIENLLYDERWRYMCHLPLHECTLHPTTLHYFRLRLLFGTINRTEIARLKAEGNVESFCPFIVTSRLRVKTLSVSSARGNSLTVTRQCISKWLRPKIKLRSRPCSRKTSRSGKADTAPIPCIRMPRSSGSFVMNNTVFDFDQLLFPSPSYRTACIHACPAECVATLFRPSSSF
ncbi:MAG TPA: transposase, partial [Armatimonadota bacterium]